ncbi:MAG: PAS domain S-box protein [Desulfobacteraceae bacterium]|nr:PAS domain S-box protein [Desulfobacteraceae bacterium]
MREKTKLLQNIIDTTSDLVAVTDMEGNFKFVGSSHSILGYDPDSLVGRNVMEFVHPDDYHKAATAFAEFLANREDGRKVEYRYRRADGDYLWFETVGKFILDDAENPKEILFSSRDFTARKQAEGELKRIEWMLSRNPISDIEAQAETHDQGYGDLTELNQDGIILKSIGPERLKRFASDYLDLLGTSSAIYEINGDYAFGIFASGWCRMMDSASRKLCVIGVINFGYGDPPKEPEKLRMLADIYHLNYNDLLREATAYNSRPPYIIEMAKKRLKSTAILIGSMVETTQAMEALRDSEEKHRRLFETMAQGVIYQTDDGAIISANPAAERILGISFEQMQGKTSMDMRWRMIKEDGTEVSGTDHPAMIALLTGETVGPVIRGVFHPDKNTYRWLSITAIPLFQPGETKPFQSYATFEDVTERKQAIEALEQREAFIKATLDNLPVGVAVNSVDPEVHFTYMNENFATFYRTTREALAAPNDFWEVVYTDATFREKIKKRVLEDCASNDPERMQWEDIPVFRPGRKPFFITAKNIPLPERDLMVSTVWDVTERKLAEENLNQAHERILTILDSIDSTVYVADMDTYEILFMNKRMITDFGGDKTGDVCYRAFRKNSEPCECCTNDQLIDKHGNPTGVCIWDDKNPVTGRYYINYDRAIEWTDGRLVRMQIATDITDLKKMETQLNQAQKMESVGRLAGGVAHDFNNMLGIILGHTELALLKTDEDNDLVSDLNEIQKAAKRSADITKQLLAFARKEIISPKQIDLNDTVESMLNMLRRLIGEDIDLSWNPAKRLWPVKMDPTQIDQILANLCVNARDAIADVGKLTIETGKKTFDVEYCNEHPGFIPGDFVLLWKMNPPF